MNNKSNTKNFRRVTSVGVLCIALFGSVVFSGCAENPSHRFRVGDIVQVVADGKRGEVTHACINSTDVYVRFWSERGYVYTRFRESSLMPALPNVKAQGRPETT